MLSNGDDLTSQKIQKEMPDTSFISELFEVEGDQPYFGLRNRNQNT